MQFKNRLTPLMMGLIAGLIVAGVVGAWAFKNQTLKGEVRLIVESMTQGQLDQLEIKFYNVANRNEIYSVNFPDIRQSRIEKIPVVIKNTNNYKIRIWSSGENDEDRIINQDSEKGLLYNYGIYFPNSSVREKDIEGLSGYTYLMTLEPDAEMEVEFFLKFPSDQNTAGKTSTDVDFEYEFKLARSR